MFAAAEMCASIVVVYGEQTAERETSSKVVVFLYCLAMHEEDIYVCEHDSHYIFLSQDHGILGPTILNC